MPDIIQLSVDPSAAILNSNDAALPTKTREPGTNQPRFTLKYSHDGSIQRAFWAWPISRQTKLGTLPGTGALRLHFTSNTTDTDDVGWRAKAGFVQEAEAIDKVLGPDVPVTVGFDGVPNEMAVAEIPLAGLFSGLSTANSGWLVVCIERDNTIGTNLARTVELLKSVIELDFISKLEVNGPVIASVPVLDPVVVLTPDLLGHHIIVDTTVVGGAVLVLLASDASPAPITPDEDGLSYFISKIGPHPVDIDIDPGGGGATTAIRGGPVPYPLFVDGDSVRLSYTAYDNVYQVW